MGDYVRWKESYSVSEPSLDAQHQQILGILNDLHVAIGAGHEYEEIRGLLDRMVTYTMNHFKCEEEIMLASGYPDFVNHRALHDAMRRRTVALRDHAGLVTGRDLLGVIKDWWVNHIQGVDKYYVPYLKTGANRQGSVPVSTQSVGPVNWLGQTPAS
jgi:hemerythrin-like metal-binding protein